MKIKLFLLLAALSLALAPLPSRRAVAVNQPMLARVNLYLWDEVHDEPVAVAANTAGVVVEIVLVSGNHYNCYWVDWGYQIEREAWVACGNLKFP